MVENRARLGTGSYSPVAGQRPYPDGSYEEAAEVLARAAEDLLWVQEDQPGQHTEALRSAWQRFVEVAPPMLGSSSTRLVLDVDVEGRPATFATASEAAWKGAVRAAVVAAGVEPEPGSRFAVRIVFRLAEPRNANEAWDLDNLVKPTLDAMEGVFGLRPWKGRPQPADDAVDHLDVRKRKAVGEPTGATIQVWAYEPERKRPLREEQR